MPHLEYAQICRECFCTFDLRINTTPSMCLLLFTIYGHIVDFNKFQCEDLNSINGK